MAMEASDQKSIYRIVRAYAKLITYGGYGMKGTVEKHIKLVKRLERLEQNVLTAFGLTMMDDLQPAIDKLEDQEKQLLGVLEQVMSDENLQALTEKHRQLKEQEEGDSRTIEQRVAEFQRLNYLLDCEYGIHSCDIYGRVEYIDTQAEVPILKQERPKIISSIYDISDRLRKLLPFPQIKAVDELLSEANGKNYAQSVLQPLEKQLAGIPKRQKPEDNPIVHAHYFMGGNDWYITEWDGKDNLFGYTILNNDVYNSEMGPISLKELQSPQAYQTLRMGENLFQQPVSAELDFFWEARPLDQVLYEYNPRYFPEPGNKKGAIIKQEPIPAPEMTIKMASGASVEKVALAARIATAINGLKTLATIKKEGPVKDKVEASIKGLETLQRIKKAA